MNESTTPRFSYRPIIWLFFILLFLWIPAICANVMKENIGDSMPGMTAGVVELLTAALFVLSTMIALTFLCFCVKGALRYVGLIVVWGGVVGGIYWFTSFYRIDFSGDMWPQRIVEIVKERKIAKEADIHDVQWEEEKPGQFPRFLGPNADLKVDWVKLDPEAEEEDFKVLWKREVGEGWSGFAAVDGVAFTMEQNGPLELVTARDVNTGEVFWIHEDTHRHAHPAGGVGPRSTPTFHHGKLYTLGGVGTLNCFDAKTGEVIWSKELLKEYDVPVVVHNEGKKNRYDEEKTTILWGRSASPLIVDDKVIVPIGGKDADSRVTLAAFNKETGEEIWTGGNRQISYGTPVLAKIGKDSQILLTTEEHVVGHDPDTGKELWSFSRPGNSGTQANTSQPIVYNDNYVLMTKEYGLGGQLVHVFEEVPKDKNEDKKSDAKEESADSESAKAKSKIWKTSSKWKNTRTLRTKLTVPVIVGDHAYCLSSGFFECTSLENGKRLWREGRYEHGQILKVGEFFLVMSEDGELSMLEADPDGVEELVKTKPLLKGRCWNTLCIYGDKLLARSDLEAVCIQLPIEK